MTKAFGIIQEYKELQLCKNCGKEVRGTASASDVLIHKDTESRLCDNGKTFASAKTHHSRPVSGMVDLAETAPSRNNKGQKMKKSEIVTAVLWVNWLVLTWMGLLGFQFSITFWWPWLALLLVSSVWSLAAYGNSVKGRE